MYNQHFQEEVQYPPYHFASNEATAQLPYRRYGTKQEKVSKRPPTS